MTSSPHTGVGVPGRDGRDVWIGLLGPFEVRRDGVPVHVTSDRLRGILAVLAASAGRTVSSDVIGDHVWGDAPPVNLRRTVQTWIARLRVMLPDDAVASRPGGYTLEVGPGQVDALRFEALLDEAAATADPHTERKLIGQALELWRGNPYDGVEAGALASVEVPRLTERYLGALERAVDLSLAGGEIDESAGRLRGETARHPLRESLWARHLRLLAAAGRTAEALATYEEVRQRLADELGADPGPELRRLHADLLDPDPASGPAGPAGTPGPAPGAVSGSAEVEVGAVRPRQLPADVDLVGRTAPLAALDDAFGIGDPAALGTVVVAVTGQGGAGKTALSVHWAHRRQAAFPDGQLFVDMRGFAARRPVEPLAALGEVLSSLGVPADQVPTGLDARAALYRTLLADRRILVVLDNVRDSEQVRPLLPGAAGRVLVTSRSALRGLSAREGARRIALDRLPVAEAEALLGDRLRRHGLTIGAPVGDDPAVGEATVAELAEQCEQLPLALVIAAEYLARHRDLDPSALVSELRDDRVRLEALDDLGDGPTASVRAVISWSYAALDPEPAGLFRLLGYLTPQEFGAEVAAAVVGAPVAATRRRLDHLADLSLLSSSRGRYRFHDLVRVFAAVLCEGADPVAERMAAAGRGLEWYIHSLHNAADRLRPKVQQHTLPERSDGVEPATFADFEAARAWAETERRALSFIAHRAYDLGRYAEAWQLTWDLGRVLLIDAAADERGDVARLGVAAAEHLGPPARYLSYNNLGNALRRSGMSESVACYREALAGCRSAGDVGTESAVLMNLGISLSSIGDTAGAIDCYTDALDAAQRWTRDTTHSALPPNVAACHLNLGNALTELGRYDDGIAHARQALELARQAGNRIIEGMSLGNLAEAYLFSGDLARAEEYCVPALALLRQLGAGDGLVDALLTDVHIKVATGRRDEARAAYDEGVTLLGTSDDRRRPQFDEALAG